MQIDAGRFQCTIQPEDFGPGSVFCGGIAFKMPFCQGDLRFVMGVAEYRQFVLTPLQKLVDSYGLDCREQIGNLGGNFFFDFRLRPTGKVWCNYELSNEDRFEPERSTVFRGSFRSDHLHLGQWLNQAYEDIQDMFPPVDWWSLINGDDVVPTVSKYQ